MPMIRVEMYEGRTLEQKRELVEVMTRESCRILKCAPEQVQIVIESRRREDWAIGGKLASDG